MDPQAKTAAKYGILSAIVATVRCATQSGVSYWWDPNLYKSTPSSAPQLYIIP